MADKNYLPFVRRQYIEVAAGARGYSRLPLFNAGQGDRVIIQDMWTVTGVSGGSWGSTSPITARIGILGYKYMTEDFISLNTWHNGERPLCSCWKFAKPYRLYPGQRLRVLLTKSGAYSTTRFGGVMFNGLRERDNKPIMLYDGDEELGGAGAIAQLNGVTLECPSDSSVLLYSMTIPEFQYNIASAVAPIVQVIGPDEREWFEAEAYDVAAPASLRYGMIAPEVSPIDLGEKNGWVLPVGQTITMELEVPADYEGTPGVWFTIRGSIEVPL